MATRRSAGDPALAADQNAGLVKARVLVDCAHGKCGTVVLVEPHVLEIDADPATGLHELDASEAAVAYAEAEQRAKAAAASVDQDQ